MHLNLKDDETVALVSEVALRLGLTKTGAVREMARLKLAELERSRESELARRERHALEWLEREVWPHSRQLRNLSTEEEEDLLGYNEMMS